MQASDEARKSRGHVSPHRVLSLARLVSGGQPGRDWRRRADADMQVAGANACDAHTPKDIARDRLAWQKLGRLLVSHIQSTWKVPLEEQ